MKRQRISVLPPKGQRLAIKGKIPTILYNNFDLYVRLTHNKINILGAEAILSFITNPGAGARLPNLPTTGFTIFMDMSLKPQIDRYFGSQKSRGDKTTLLIRSLAHFLASQDIEPFVNAEQRLLQAWKNTKFRPA